MAWPIVRSPGQKYPTLRWAKIANGNRTRANSARLSKAPETDNSTVEVKNCQCVAIFHAQGESIRPQVPEGSTAVSIKANEPNKETSATVSYTARDNPTQAARSG